MNTNIPIDDGGPAFPITTAAWERGHTGMSLRDYAEIHFISALIASPRALISAGIHGVTSNDYINAGKLVAKVWLAARKEKP
jgi:hypothetical protein